MQMIKIYASILLLSFLAGIFQPVIPMVQYHIQKGNLFELLADLDRLQRTDDHFCTHDDLTLSDDWQHENQDMLIDADFYPIPIKPGYSPDRAILPILFRGYQYIDFKLCDRFLKRYTPPPRI